MDRKLASVVKVLKVEPIEGADAIEKVSVLGWQVVSRKGEFKEGDKAVYFEVDSFLPIKPEFEFLRKSSYKKLVDGSEGFRLKTIKLRKTLSQGLLLPISILKFRPENDYKEGEDVTEILEVVKYDPPLPAQLSGIAKGNFPGFIPKTDEIRVQSEPAVIEELRGKPFYITVKMDGTSGTFYMKDGEFGVCSRNLELKETEGNSFWAIAKKYGLVDKMAGKNIAIQGEVVGPGIQKNPLLLKEVELHIFSIYDITDGKYWDFKEVVNFCGDNGLKFVPVEEVDGDFCYALEQLLEKAKGTYGSGKQREGIVIRPQTETYSETLKGRLSFKVLNNDYLLKEE